MKKSLKRATEILTIVSILNMPSAWASETINEDIDQDAVNILLNGNYLASDVAPIIQNGRVLVPIRAIGEALDTQVSWYVDANEIILQRRDKKIKLNIGNNIAEINGKIAALDISPQIIDNRTMVPLRFIGESLDCAVEWDEKERTVSLQERYRTKNGSDEVVLIPIEPDKDSEYSIYHRMQVAINGIEREYNWNWNAGSRQYIAFDEPSINWEDLNGDGKDEIIIILTDGVNRGTGVLLQDVHVLEHNGEEIIVADAREYAKSLAAEKNAYVLDWTEYALEEGKLIAKAVVLEDDEQTIWRMTYFLRDNKLEIGQIWCSARI